MAQKRNAFPAEEGIKCEGLRTRGGICLRKPLCDFVLQPKER